MAPQSQSQKAALNSAACSGIHPHQLSPKQRLRNIMLLHVNSPLPVSLHTVPPSLCPFTVEKRRANKDAAAAMPPPLLRALIEVCALYAAVYDRRLFRLIARQTLGDATTRRTSGWRPSKGGCGGFGLLKKELPSVMFNFSLTWKLQRQRHYRGITNSGENLHPAVCTLCCHAVTTSPPLHSLTTLIHVH